MRLILAEPFKSLWDGKDAFEAVEGLQGQVYRELEARRTLRTEVNGQGYFVKIHRGVGWGEIVKNLITARLPVLGAGQEWTAIQRLHEAGVSTMTAVAYGERGSNPAQQHSFIITEELAPTVDLEQLTLTWLEQPPALLLKRALVRRVAQMTGRMHAAGVNHRDCYICHFLLHTDKPFDADDFRLSVIDLHRAQVRNAVPKRWRNKDLAGLYFSALHIGLSRRDLLRFIKIYFGVVDSRPLRQILHDEATLLRWLQGKADRLRARYARKYQPEGGA
ncbi:lipopolysaccharide core heptose(I) kinase RfaP [Pseudomonas sp. PA15(2017)]|uniref:lipopolysaccharide core heptose(I) kinase RfaP n=1 Tax=Pseudomonas sp. PA15(2017) TaxID=1932111 RepID=UPI00095E6A2C|nr:lipopolysaccharide core heptose(I) kinase RfaP [Pseudomonas sp. PA15(2017)]OLU24556.1 lipopolysaccharide core heptose(I) kinase RfaP [Pseudomonas sp. PA15(2017)]